MRKKDPDLLILYGSETGAAQDVAERLWRDAKRRRVKNVRIYAMDEYEFRRLFDEELAVFICSTTGQGDETTNMKRFWRLLCQRRLPSNSLAGLSAVVLGLGDSSYQKYNFAAKKLYRRLSQLGANHLLQLSLADDQHEFGSDSVVEPWLDNVWNVLQDQYEVSPLSVDAPEPLPKFLINFNDCQAVDFLPSQTPDVEQHLTPCSVELISNVRVTAPNHFQDTRLVRFDLGDHDISYEPGDVLSLQPQNLSETAEEFLQMLAHFDIEKPFFLVPTDQCFRLPADFILPSPCTLRQSAERYFDLQACPRRSFFERLAYFAEKDSLEHEKLLEFASKEGQEDYFSYCTRPRRTVVETMRDFPNTTVRAPLEAWFDLIPGLRPRSFSIASCPDVHGKQVEILVGIVRYQTRLSSPRLGVASNWLSRLSPGARVHVRILKGTLYLPFSTPSIPCVLIGPGTGVAPFRSFLHFRCFRSQGDNVLFFGCRNEANDFYFRSEFEQMQRDGLLRLEAVFSRDREEEIGKRYVQHRIAECGSWLASIIVERNAHIFIAGSAKQMPNDVLAALKNILTEYFAQKQGSTALAENDIENYIAVMEKTKRLQMETWT